MLTGRDSLQMYTKGIEVLKQDAERYRAGLRADDAALATKQAASAFASMSDLFMTDLW